MKTMKDYNDLYLKYDTLLLADVFEKFRNNSLKNYGLCSSYYLSAAAISSDAMLNMAKVELELIPDPDMYIFFEKGTRVRAIYGAGNYALSTKYSSLRLIVHGGMDGKKIDVVTTLINFVNTKQHLATISRNQRLLATNQAFKNKTEFRD